MSPSFPFASQPTFPLVRDGDTIKRAIAWVIPDPGIFVVCLVKSSGSIPDITEPN